VPVVVDDLRVVAGDDLSGGAGAGPTRAAADEDVQHLRRADAVEHLDAERGREALEQCRREGLTGRDAGPYAGEGVLGKPGGEQRCEVRGPAEEQCGP
jgi:hypothetical protein